MPEPICCDLHDLAIPEIPLPWTTGGPNDHSNPQQMAASSLSVSVSDPIFYFKNRIIDMKQLETIKKRLPPGIDIRINSKNTLTFRARFRRKGYPDQIQTFPDPKLAKQWLDEQQRNALLGIHLPHIQSSKHTLSEAIDRYLLEELPRKPKNARNVKQHLEWFRKELGQYALSAIRPSIITEKRTLLEQGITSKKQKRSPTTVLRYLTSLSHLFAVAVRDWEWLHENPMEKISKPRATPGRQRYLSTEERKRLLDAVLQSRCPVLYAIVVLALSTGMRRGEIINLRWQNIDLENHKITLATTKNSEPRHVPLVGNTLKAISALLPASKQPHPADLLFPSPTTLKRPYDIQSAWKTSMKKAKLENFTFHDLRHSTASYQAANGRNLFEIGHLLGHKSPQTTKRYAHLTHEHTSQMVEELDHKLFGA